MMIMILFGCFCVICHLAFIHDLKLCFWVLLASYEKFRRIYVPGMVGTLGSFYQGFGHVLLPQLSTGNSFALKEKSYPHVSSPFPSTPNDPHPNFGSPCCPWQLWVHSRDNPVVMPCIQSAYKVLLYDHWVIYQDLPQWLCLWMHVMDGWRTTLIICNSLL